MVDCHEETVSGVYWHKIQFNAESPSLGAPTIPAPTQILFPSVHGVTGVVFSPHDASVFWQYPGACPFLSTQCLAQRCILGEVLVRATAHFWGGTGFQVPGGPLSPIGIFPGLLVGSSKCWAQVEIENVRLSGSQMTCRF